jgi:uncharacterized protein (DUF4415 family)
MSENKQRITRVSGDEARRLKGETDYARIDAMTDDDIAKAVAEDPDAAPLDIDWTKARLVIPPGKDIITLRLDRDVLDWLRAQGKGYQTLINQVLRAFYDAQIGRPKREKIATTIQKTAQKRATKKAATNSNLPEREVMTTVYIEARPKGRREGSAIEDYVVEEQGDRVLKTFKTQAEAIAWAKSEGHSPHVARVRHLNDKKIPDHWRLVS